MTTRDRSSSLSSSSSPSPAEQRARTLLEKMSGEIVRAHNTIRRMVCADVPGPDSEQDYCWWCHRDINGKSGLVEEHASDCVRVEADRSQSELSDLIAADFDRELLALIDDLTLLRGQREEMRTYLQHKVTCGRQRACAVCGLSEHNEIHENPTRHGHDYETSETCTCGLSAVLRSADAVPPKEK